MIDIEEFKKIDEEVEEELKDIEDDDMIFQRVNMDESANESQDG